MASGERWKNYKTKGNVEEGRRRREEEGVQLRKSKREEVSSTFEICIVNVHEMELYMYNLCEDINLISDARQ